MTTANERELLHLHHRGTEPGHGDTTRTNLWFAVDPTTQFSAFLSKQVTSLGHQGTVDVVRTEAHRAGVKAQLIIDDSVDPDPAATAWIHDVNAVIDGLPEETIASFLGKDAILTSQAADPTAAGSSKEPFGGPIFS